MKKNMRKIVILAVMFVIAFNCFAETSVKEKSIYEQRIEKNRKYEEDLLKYGIDKAQYEIESSKLQKKFYEDSIQYYEKRAKILSKIEKAEKVLYKTTSKEEKQIARKRINDLREKLKNIKAPEYPTQQLKELNIPEYPKY